MTGRGSSHNAFKDFLEEAEDISDRLGTELADLVDAAESGELDPDLLNSIFRGAHSLKGLAGMFGLANISNVSHALENLLDRLRLGKLNLNKPLLALLLESHMLIEALLCDVSVEKVSAHAVETAACVARISASLTSSEGNANDSASNEPADFTERLLGSLTEYEEYRRQENINKGKQLYFIRASFELTSFDLELARLMETLKSRGEIISTLPGIGDRIDTHIDFDILFGTALQFEEVDALVSASNIAVTCAGQLPESCYNQISPMPDLGRPVIPVFSAENGLLPVTDAAILDTPGKDVHSVTRRPSRTVRVDIGKLDELLHTVGDLVLSHATIFGIAERLRNQGITRLGVDLYNASKQLERRLTDLRKGVMEIRMIPVGRLYEKMSRIVRRISCEQGKLVELNLIGADTELDKLIVEEISDPMMHIIRNAIDHGIETPELRVALGKNPHGTITVSACQRGSHVVIEIGDDGSGIDIERVRSNALSKGFVRDPDVLSDREALDLIFRPGFSTSDTISEVSGRGVGLDVVKNNINAISGQVSIETGLGSGTRFSLRIPITLAIIKALIVSCAGRTYALPTSAVYEALFLNRQDISCWGKNEVIHVRETTLPLLRLDNFFGIDRLEKRPEEFYAVVVGVGERRMGLVVDDLLGQQDIVIKPLGLAFKGLGGISGAADLGDQRTILVLDVAAIFADAMNIGS